jgi:CheY-like chemotaxis protein
MDQPTRMGAPEGAATTDEPAGGVVYVIDDDTELREYLRWLLEPAGWRVETYGEPAEFLAAYRSTGAACIVTDVCMPGLSGLDLQRELGERGIHLPIILISAYAEVPDVVRAMRGSRTLADHERQPLQFGGRSLAQRLGENVGQAPDREQGVAQLVRHGRREVGLDRVRPLEVLEQPRVAERQRGKRMSPCAMRAVWAAAGRSP